MDKPPAKQEQQPQKRILTTKEQVEYTALLAISVAILQAYVSVNSPDRHIIFSTSCFSLAIPMLAATLYQQHRDVEPMKRTTIIGNIGSALALFGIGFTFIHIYQPAALLFALSGIGSILILFLIKQKPKKQP
jgi:peptidoglycan/LPS O-acetylase OafA/YrhL